ncbi:Na(+)-translocating NADH-quinone reductase subunit C [Xanthomarina sp. F2636L]|uniref:Na(+)-translocating NADH-quinone reductase subunit C n=1 Tax=Xanthomarina sp. F2636L TaxID=2996018 RepID=UPI00225E60FD|nr:Na(+)-translocating NADH-quinone reductase subunit C [Xanthomarina sp. F2636L]MCX7550809.1 Na(+)-translocating NADH-quinone reductase subunit C [Xanthomarina sp. F2636L]
MEKRTDKNSYTIIFAIGMVLVVGSLLAYASSSLKDKITTNRELEKQQNILYAMGINENDDSNAIFVSTEEAPKLFSEYITKQLVIQGDEVTEDDKAYLIDVKKEQTNAKAGKERRLPLFVGEKEGQTFYIAPIRGKGLWDAIWAYIAMDEDMVIQGAFFDHKGETAGLGANINKRFFMDDFIGEDLMNDGEFVGVTVAKGNADPLNIDKTDNEVDAIAGSTITGDGVSAMLKSELRLYVPYFKTLKNN